MNGTVNPKVVISLLVLALLPYPSHSQTGLGVVNASALGSFFVSRPIGYTADNVLVRATDSSVSERIGWYWAGIDPIAIGYTNLFLGERIVATFLSSLGQSGSAPLGALGLTNEKLSNGVEPYYEPPIWFPAIQSEPNALSTRTTIWPDLVTANFTATRSAPLRVSSNGVAFDAIAVRVEKDGSPWKTWYFGLNLGLVGVTADNPAAGPGFMAVKLPAPEVTGLVVEYVNTEDFPTAPGGHYFYTADPQEQAALDAGIAGHFSRTGRSFKTGGHAHACRFYGSTHPGPNSHFFSIDRSECDALRSKQLVPIPSDAQQWNDEGIAFTASVPVSQAPATYPCAFPQTVIHRLYNNAFTTSGKNPWDSNHRYVSNALAEVPEMVAKGWRNEGVAFCVQP